MLGKQSEFSDRNPRAYPVGLTMLLTGMEENHG